MKMLSKTEMRSVKGGEGTCRYWCEGANGLRMYSNEKVTKDVAIEEATDNATSGNCARGGWCCASCPF